MVPLEDEAEIAGDLVEERHGRGDERDDRSGRRGAGAFAFFGISFHFRASCRVPIHFDSENCKRFAPAVGRLCQSRLVRRPGTPSAPQNFKPPPSFHGGGKETGPESARGRT